MRLNCRRASTAAAVGALLTVAGAARAQLPPTLGQAVDQPAWAMVTGGHAGWTGQGAVEFSGAAAGQSGAISHNQTSFFETRQSTAAGFLTFTWKVSSEYRCDHLRFFVDGELRREISGETGWTLVGVPVLDNLPHVYRWEYSKDYTLDAGADAGWVDRVGFTSVPPPVALEVGDDRGVGVDIRVERMDGNGDGDGTTEFRRSYAGGDPVRLEAPVSAGTGGNHEFRGWLGCDAVEDGVGAGTVCVVGFPPGEFFRPLQATYEVPVSAALDQPAWPFEPGAWEGAATGRDGVDSARVYVWDAAVASAAVTRSFDGVTDRWLSFWCRLHAGWAGETLELLIDDVPAASCPAGGRWERVAIQVPAGAHTLRWTASAHGGVAEAWLDEVIVSSGPPPSVLNVTSTRAGVPIAVDPPDRNGLGDGATELAREYDRGVPVRLTAPLAAGARSFTGWSGCDSTAGPAQEECVVDFGTDEFGRTVEAGYDLSFGGALGQAEWPFEPGGWRPLDAAGHDGVGGAYAHLSGGDVVSAATTRIFDAVQGGAANFWCRIDSWAGGGSLEVLVDGAPAAFCPATGRWERVYFLLPPGEHTVLWTASANGGEAEFHLDELAFIPGGTIPNAPPQFVPAGSHTGVEGEPLGFTVRATDAIGQVVTLAAPDLPPGAAFDPATGAFEWTPGLGQGGAWAITFRATDDGTPPLTAEQVVAVTVVEPAGPVFFDDLADGAAPADWRLRTGTWSSTGGVLTAGSIKRMNLGLVALLDPARLPLGAGVIQAKMKLTSVAGRGGPNGMIVFGYRDAANYRWAKVTPAGILIGQTGTLDGVGPGVKKKALKAQRLGRFTLFTVKVHPDGLVEVYKGAATSAVVSYRFTAGGSGSVAPGGAGVGSLRAKTLFDNVTVWEDSALR